MSSWSNLSSQDKDAFYSILDEYFSSRPHLFQQSNNAASGNPYAAASSLAAAHPGVAASALRAAGVPKNVASSNNISTASKWSQNPKVVAASSKVSQLAGKWSGPANGNESQNSTTPPAPPASRKPGSALPEGLQSSQKFMGGMVSQAEKDAMRAKPSGVLAAAVSSSHKSSFAPPPVRKTGPITPTPAPVEDDLDGEFVEAMYDFDGTSPQDLSFKERQVIRVTEHISDDWWNGQIDNGPIGMFPSAYVKAI
ncbi:hypothetical protein CROQUDRAFT_655489 [Cronartium quercuum f. sp. fusiforme G11]|uniref:SH3 domain-containing protein n=1 Tax=Cronartium quercuum f. sp. fusiforme G11 TaxID=708437 RepID=A0A9P6TDM2_9BASI|nr:hypothetical protein CROQUDRAFT_655489 [Cronartium quercuum f. sp. fusiforme G11]